jgi:hypothetical protein
MSLLTDAISASKFCSLFISHAWQYGEQYESLVNLLNNDGLFQWANLSVPNSNPLPKLGARKSFWHLVRQLDYLVAKADCVLIIAGMYGDRSEYIQTEIDAAKHHGRPIVAVRPWGQERMPEAVTEAADEIVGWYTSSIVSAVRRVCSPPQKDLRATTIENISRAQAISKSMPLAPPQPLPKANALGVVARMLGEETPKRTLGNERMMTIGQMMSSLEPPKLTFNEQRNALRKALAKMNTPPR